MNEISKKPPVKVDASTPSFGTPSDPPPLPKTPEAPAKLTDATIVDCYQHVVSDETPYGGVTVVLSTGHRVYVGKELFKTARWATPSDPVGA